MNIQRREHQTKSPPAQRLQVIQVDRDEFCRLLISRRALVRGSQGEDFHRVLIDPGTGVRYEADSSFDG